MNDKYNFNPKKAGEVNFLVTKNLMTSAYNR